MGRKEMGGKTTEVRVREIGGKAKGMNVLGGKVIG